MKKKLALLLAIAMTLGQTQGYVFAAEPAGNDTEVVTEDADTEEEVSSEEDAATEDEGTIEAEAAVEVEAAVDEEDATAAGVQTPDESETMKTDSDISKAQEINETEKKTGEDEPVLLNAPAQQEEQNTEANELVQEENTADGQSQEGPGDCELQLDYEYGPYYRDGEYNLTPYLVEMSGRDYRINYTLGIWNSDTSEWIDMFTEGEEYSVSGDELTLYGEKVGGEGTVTIRVEAEAVDAADNSYLTRDYAYITLKQPSVTVESSKERAITLNSYFWTMDQVDLYVENAEHPYGEYYYMNESVYSLQTLAAAYFNAADTSAYTEHLDVLEYLKDYVG